jgi:hypothetical protein
MKSLRSIGVAAWLAAGLLAPAVLAAAESTEAAVSGLSSKKDKGVVSVMADPALSGGRLILKVVAYNKTDQPTAFSDNQVKVFKASGKPVNLITLEQLIAEVRGESPARTARHDPSNYDGRPIGQDDAGRPDVAGYSGSGNPMAGVVSRHTDTNAGTRVDDPATRAQVESLKTAILHSMTIEPSKAAGGQVVTEKLRFGRKDEKALRVVVSFNGEEHEFSFVPPER